MSAQENTSYVKALFCIFLSIVLVIGLCPSNLALAEETPQTEGTEQTEQGESSGDNQQNPGSEDSNFDGIDEGDGTSPNGLPSNADNPGGGSEPEPSEDPTDPVEEQPALTARAHVASYGWQAAVTADAGETVTVGTTGQSRAIEALELSLEGLEGSVEYKTHVQGIGWQDWVTDGELAGTTGQSRRTEAVQIQLTGAVADQYDVYYRVHSQSYGTLGWAKNGQKAGTEDLSKRMEQLEVVLVAKDGGTAPDGYTDGSDAYLTTVIKYTSHVQGIGTTTENITEVTGFTLGTTGQHKRLEGIGISMPGVEGGITYQAHVAGIGWQGWASDGAFAGTTGQSRAIEAVKIKLTGVAADTYDIYYRVHVANIGWLDWTSNGETAGTTGAGAKAEAVQVAFVEKGGAAPGSTTLPYINNDDLGISMQCMSGTGGSTSYSSVGMGATAGTTGQSRALTGIAMTVSGAKVSGGISYKAHVANAGWLGATSDGGHSQSGSNAVQAISVSLTGSLATYYDVYYRVHVANYGWMGWAKNGAYAGTTGLSRNAEAYQVVIVTKGASAPGSTAKSFSDQNGFLGGPSSDAELNNIVRSIIARYGTGSSGLRAAFNYVSSLSYRNGSKYPSGNWASWSVPMAKEMYYNGSGNCYRYASLFCWIARGLGYDAKVIAGECPNRSTGRGAHGWVEIRKNGTTYVCDAQLQHKYPSRNWYMVTYANAPMTYYK